MNTIYRFNDSQTRELLYIGVTNQPLAKRLVFHLVAAKNHVKYRKTATEVAIKRSIGILRAHAGFRPITMTAIAQVEDRDEALLIEATLIGSEAPPWNVKDHPTHGPAYAEKALRAGIGRLFKKYKVAQ